MTPLASALSFSGLCVPWPEIITLPLTRDAVKLLHHRPSRVLDRLSEAVEYAVDLVTSAGKIDLIANRRGYV